MLCTRMIDTSPIWMAFLNYLKTRIIGKCVCNTYYTAVVINVDFVRQYMLNVQVQGDNIE